MTNAEILALNNAITSLMAEDEKYKVKFSFALTKNRELLQPTLKTFEIERNKLLDTYNTKDKNGKPLYLATGNINIPAENIEEWNKEMQELLDIDVKVDIQKISFDDLPDLIKPSILDIISKFMLDK